VGVEMLGESWKSVTPLWELIVVGTLGSTITVLTCAGWVCLFRQHGPLRATPRWAFLTGLVILTTHTVLGAALFSLPGWVVPNHDRVGVGWFFASPIVMLFVGACGCASWRASGRTLVLAGLAGLSLWAIVAGSVAI
jgi:hypothetical protein